MGLWGRLEGRDWRGGEGGVDLTEWFEMVAFDVLGEMAFGEGFGCVENGLCFLLSFSSGTMMDGCCALLFWESKGVFD